MLVKFLLVKRSSHQLRQILRMSSPRLTLSSVDLDMKTFIRRVISDVTYKHRVRSFARCFATDVPILNDTFIEENSHTVGTLTHVNVHAVDPRSNDRRERLRQRLLENSGLCVTGVVLQVHLESIVALRPFRCDMVSCRPQKFPLDPATVQPSMSVNLSAGIISRISTHASPMGSNVSLHHVHPP